MDYLRDGKVSQEINPAVIDLRCRLPEMVELLVDVTVLTILTVFYTSLSIHTLDDIGSESSVMRATARIARRDTFEVAPSLATMLW